MTLLYVSANYGIGGPGQIAYQAEQALKPWAELEPPRARMCAPPPDTELAGQDAFVERLAFVWMPEDLTVLHAFNNVALTAMMLARERFPKAKVIIERASTHPDHQREIMLDERAKILKEPKMQSLYEDACHLQMKWEISHADVVVTPSEQAADTIRQAVKPSPDVHVIEFGSDPETFTPMDYNLKPEGFKVLYMGANWIRKGLKYLEQGFGEVAKIGWRLDANVPATLPPPSFVGGPSPRPRIVHCGAIDEKRKAEFYRKHDVFCLPSLEEGQAIAVWEALASGLPCIVTQECGHPLIGTEKAGIILNEDIEWYKLTGGARIERITRALMYYADNESELKAHGANAHHLALERTWKDYQNDLVNLWDEMGA
jgi:glycosyltransferase involved in cell wall biosynthesis